MSATELEAACRKCMRVEVSQTAALSRVLEGVGVEYKILSDTTADIYAKLNISELTHALDGVDCELIALTERDESLESFFMELIGGGEQ